MRWMVLVAAATAGCGEVVCTEMGCGEPPARLELKPPLADLGTYHIVLWHDGTKSDCRLVLPLDDQPDCDLRVEKDEAGALAAILLPQPWLDVKLVIIVEGAWVASTELILLYRTSRPNGPGCEPVCYESKPLPVDTLRPR